MMCCGTHVSNYVYFFFFKQKTAYEMRISDLSSDVCSSDLIGHGEEPGSAQGEDRGDEEILEKGDLHRLGHFRLPPREDEVVGVEDRGEEHRADRPQRLVAIIAAELARDDDDHPREPENGRAHV